eukprot:TRINITY_DN2432_c0_g1_i10.p1 TRINITY_DN2432_c0_g1~~TRINITY_DN2432_c0_g1_i10.p1  ORF type:complete len:971 (+),score=224.51 TRINITY_DN2432_c0_g1_i10:447-3359(+)
MQADLLDPANGWLVGDQIFVGVKIRIPPDATASPLPLELRAATDAAQLWRQPPSIEARVKAFPSIIGEPLGAATDVNHSGFAGIVPVAEALMERGDAFSAALQTLEPLADRVVAAESALQQACLAVQEAGALSGEGAAAELAAACAARNKALEELVTAQSAILEAGEQWAPINEHVAVLSAALKPKMPLVETADRFFVAVQYLEETVAGMSETVAIDQIPDRESLVEALKAAKTRADGNFAKLLQSKEAASGQTKIVCGRLAQLLEQLQQYEAELRDEKIDNEGLSRIRSTTDKPLEALTRNAEDAIEKLKTVYRELPSLKASIARIGISVTTQLHPLSERYQALRIIASRVERAQFVSQAEAQQSAQALAQLDKDAKILAVDRGHVELNAKRAAIVGDTKAIEAAQAKIEEIKASQRALAVQLRTVQTAFAAALEVFPELRMSHPHLLTPEQERLGSLLQPGLSSADYVVVRKLGVPGAQNHEVELRQREGRECVVKTYRLDGDAERSFYRESCALRQLQHPCVVAVQAAFVGVDAEGRRYGCLEEEFCAGGDLVEWLRSGERALGDRLRVLRDVARALEHVHRSGLVHCDVKPGNVYVRSDGSGVLGDFDVSRSAEQRTMVGATILPTAMSGAGAFARGMVGTVEFMAPEIKSGGAARACSGSDMFSYGLTVEYALNTEFLSSKATSSQRKDATALIEKLKAAQPEARPSATAVLSNGLFAAAGPDAHAARAAEILRLPAGWATSGLEATALATSEHSESAAVVSAVQTLMRRSSGNGTPYVVRRVTRLENAAMFRTYAAERDFVLSRAPAGGCKAVEGIKTMASCPEALFKSQELRGGANEVLLLHGTKSSSVGAIKVQGLDNRAVSKTGKFGRGLYFAEDTDKAHAYTDASGDGTRFMVVARVVLGSAHHTAVAVPHLLRPPVDPGSGHALDSVVAAAGAGVSQHREFVVYKQAQAYAQYVVEYTV